MRIALLAIISLLAFTASASDNPVTQAVITTGVTSGAQPQTSNLTVVDARVGTITFYTEITGLTGQQVTHRWYYRGREVSSVTLSLASGRSINWSRSTIAPTQLGEWEARVVDSGGRVLVARAFNVVESGQSVQRVVQQRQVDACQVKLADLERQVEENPTVDYYRFLYERQQQRCNSN